MELQHRLSNVADMSGVERQLARRQELWDTEYNKFIAERTTFLNKEINDSRHSIVVMSDSIRELRISNTHYHESTPATSQRMDKVQNQVTSTHSDLKEQINQAVQKVKTKLRTEFKAALDKKVVSLETFVESRVNEVCQDTNSTLEQLKEIVAAMRESQERMWRAIDGMSQDVQELVQRDVGTKADEDREPLPVVANPTKEELVPAKTSTIAQPIQRRQFLHDLSS